MIKRKLPAILRRKKSSSPQECLTTPRVITFWFPKTTGKTILAAAMAAALARAGKRVACVDLDLLTPDLPRKRYSLDTMLGEFLRGDFDPAKTAQSLTCFKPEGVYILPGPTDMVRADSLGKDEFFNLVSALAENYDAVLLDTNRSLVLEATLVALDIADLIIVPVAPADNIVRHVGRYLAILEHDLRLDKEKVRVMVNQLSGKAVIATAAIEQVLGKKVAGEIPFRREWRDWYGDKLPPVNGWEDLLLGLVAVPVQTGPGKEEPAYGPSELDG